MGKNRKPKTPSKSDIPTSPTLVPVSNTPNPALPSDTPSPMPPMVQTSNGLVEALPPRQAISLLQPALFMQDPNAWHDDDLPLLVNRNLIMEFFKDGFNQGKEEALAHMETAYHEGVEKGKEIGIWEALTRVVLTRKEEVKKAITCNASIQTDSPATFTNSSVPTTSSSNIAFLTDHSPPCTSTPIYPDPDISWSDVIPAQPPFDLAFNWSDEAEKPLPPPMHTPRDFSDLRSEDVKNPFSSLSRRHRHHYKKSSVHTHSANSHPRFLSHSSSVRSGSHDTAHIANWRSLKSFIRSVVLEATRTSSHLKGALGVGARACIVR